MGKYLCFVRQDWSAGLPLLMMTADQELKAVVSKELSGTVDVKVIHDAISGELEFYIDNRLIQRDPMTITPRPDQGMPVFLGGASGAGYRYPGLVRNVWLGNVK